MARSQHFTLKRALLSRRQCGGFNPHALPAAGGGRGSTATGFQLQWDLLGVGPHCKVREDRHTDRLTVKKAGGKPVIHQVILRKPIMTSHWVICSPTRGVEQVKMPRLLMG